MCQSLDDVMFAEYKAFLAQGLKVSANILSTARAALGLWSDPDIMRLTDSNSVDIEALRREKTAAYLIIIPEDKVRYFALIINLFYSACFECCLHEYNPDCQPVFFLDEFGNLPDTIEQLPLEAITTSRKRLDTNRSFTNNLKAPPSDKNSPPKTPVTTRSISQRSEPAMTKKLFSKNAISPNNQRRYSPRWGGLCKIFHAGFCSEK